MFQIPPQGLEQYHGYLDAISTVLIAIVGWIVSRIDRKFTAYDKKIEELRLKNEKQDLALARLETKLNMGTMD